jgi:hypothetical protein
LFSHDPGRLQKARKIANRLFAETNLSATGLRDVIRALLETFEIPKGRLQLFLREDRNAGSESA